ncbi:hypothetical protein [robinz microvirus RP_48]|nr:hypothetical protein [robinz microvirus RP_48]
MSLPKLKFLDAKGHEIPDPQPLEIPARFKRPETLAEQIRRVTKGALSLQAAEQGFETFEEAEDFEIDDDSFDPSSPYEEIFDPTLGRGITLQEFHTHEETYKRRYEQAEAAAWKTWDRSEALRGRRASAPPASNPDSKSGPQADQAVPPSK